MRHSFLAVALIAASGVVASFACGSSDSGGGGAAPGGTVPSGNGDSGSVDSSAPGQPSQACGTTGAKTGYVGQQSISVNGTTRTYALDVPPQYNGKTAYPIVVAYHGDGGTGAELRGSIGLEQASSNGAIFAYLDGNGTPDDSWDNDTPQGVGATVAFTEAVIASLESTYCSDASKVFLTGFSRGAYTVNQVACRTKVKLRGIVSNSGGGPFGVQDSDYDKDGNVVCAAPPVPAMQVHGDSDGTVDVTEGEKTRDYWKGVNGCQDGTTPRDPSPCVVYDGCARTEEWCEIPGMDHQIWSSSASATWSFYTSL